MLLIIIAAADSKGSVLKIGRQHRLMVKPVGQAGLPPTTWISELGEVT